MVARTQPVYLYRLDDCDVIVYVDEWWLAFARENGAHALVQEKVLGRSLWEFISDKPTQQLYRELHRHVRESKQAVLVPFRCDSPTLKRYMELKISLYLDGQLLYESRLQRAIPQQRLAALEVGREQSQAFLTMCSICKRALLEPAGWLELQDISLKLRTFEQTIPHLRYTVCPQCANPLQ